MKRVEFAEEITDKFPPQKLTSRRVPAAYLGLVGLGASGLFGYSLINLNWWRFKNPIYDVVVDGLGNISVLHGIGLGSTANGSVAFIAVALGGLMALSSLFLAVCRTPLYSFLTTLSGGAGVCYCLWCYQSPPDILNLPLGLGAVLSQLVFQPGAGLYLAFAAALSVGLAGLAALVRHTLHL